MNQPIFALVDCNNFFVSCERIFRPDLEGRPVVVLSSNDGCAVARSNEAKALGIPMGAPAFKYRQVFKNHNVIQFSANFSLYGDVSRRIISILASMTPRIEVYSVDESFLDLRELPISNHEAWGKMVRQALLDWVGVPVSIGIAPTKTLAKLASDRAKKNPDLAGVLQLKDNFDSWLQATPIQDIWGVGRRLAPRLRAEGIASALDLATMRPQHARQLMGVHGTQLVAELNGTACHELTLVNRPCQSIARTRTFGEDTNDYGSIQAAIANFTTRAAYQLRTSHQLARKASLFLTSNKHKPGYKYWSREIKLQTPTDDTGILLQNLVGILGQLYSKSVSYHRAGIGLYDFIPVSSLQIDLLGNAQPDQINASRARMEAIDNINDRYGKEHIGYAAEKLSETWQPKYRLRSPRYTTHWDELPKIKIR